MRVRFCAALAQVMGLICLGGCYSTRVVASLKIPDGVSVASQEVKLNIVKVEYHGPGAPEESSAGPRSRPASGPWATMDLRKAMMEQGLQHYPQLFSEGPESVPVVVCIKGQEKRHEALFLFSMLCSCDTLFTIFPGPQFFTTVFSVEGRVEIPEMDAVLSLTESKFVLRVRSWVSLFLPTALIPIPGPSDIRKRCRIGGSYPQGIDPPTEDMVNLCVGSFVQALAESYQKDASKLSEFLHKTRIGAPDPSLGLPPGESF